MAGRPSSPVLSIGSDLASRIKAKLSLSSRRRRRRSAAPSLDSSWSETSASSPSQVREQLSSLSSVSGTQQHQQHRDAGDEVLKDGDDKADGAVVAERRQPNVGAADSSAATATTTTATTAVATAGGGGGAPGADDSGAAFAGPDSARANSPTTGSSAASPRTSPTRHLTKAESGNDQRQTSALHPSSTLQSINEASSPSLSSVNTSNNSTPTDDDDDDDDDDEEDEDDKDDQGSRRQSDNGPVDQAPLSHPITPSSPTKRTFATAPQTSPARDSPAAPTSPPNLLVRRQSLIPSRQAGLIGSLLESPQSHGDQDDDDGVHEAILAINPKMVTRKIWVKRPGASATLVTINEDDLVDDVRDMILRKYANSLGRAFDSPDLTIRINPREHQKERVLGPEEPMSRTIEAYFPGGQTVDEALIIDVPPRRTPKPSPRVPVPHSAPHYYDDGRPSENGEGYFPPIGGGIPSPHLPVAVPTTTNGVLTHSISVLGTGHVPPIPSPGGNRSRTYRERPRLGRTHTSSPTIINGAGVSVPMPAAATSHDHNNVPPAAPPLPVSPGRQEPPHARVATPPPRIASPRPSNTRIKKSKKIVDHPSLPGMLNNSVPPISVLIVEDNPINLKLLEAFVKKLKVRWQTAMNGRDAVKKWRTGGFHLVLMDIQLPVMNGLEATREIRRLERVNSIGVFTQSTSSSGDGDDTDGELEDKDRLEKAELFKSPVIIVALTASSLQSDRHEALAAGCNDFLTKPVNFVWLERKVMEWGCMQALIDFDGWRQWKDFSQQQAQEEEANKKTTAAKPKPKKPRASVSSVAA